jgi:hypothetical protein
MIAPFLLWEDSVMRSDTEQRNAAIAFDGKGMRETPRAIAVTTWVMIGVLALIAIIGAMLLSGFFSAGTGS